MNYTMMTYTIARQQGGRPDMVKICRLANELGLETLDQVTLYGYEAAEVRRIADDHGLRIICYTFFADLNFPDASGRAPGLDALKGGIEIAVTLGAPAVMLPIGAKEGLTRGQSRRNVIEGLLAGVPIGRRAGVTVTVEHFPQADSPFVTAADVNEAVARVPGLGVTFDCGNCLTGGDDPGEAFLAGGKQIVHAHFKDWVRVGPGEARRALDGNCYRPALIGEGVVDYPALLATMKKAGYKGGIDIEYEGDDYPADEACRRAVDYLRGVEAGLD
jgi:sugar phosphate isomerase/epimerase